MTYYERFRGGYDVQMARIYERRQKLIDKARELQPQNMDQLLAASEDGEFDHKLGWVSVPNPWRPSDGDTIRVMPVLGITSGYEDAEQEKDRGDKGAWKLGIIAHLPAGDTWYMGDVMFFYTDGKLKHEPIINLNTSPTSNSFGSECVQWDSADAEIFLALAESALEEQ